MSDRSTNDAVLDSPPYALPVCDDDAPRMKLWLCRMVAEGRSNTSADFEPVAPLSTGYFG